LSVWLKQYVPDDLQEYQQRISVLSDLIENHPDAVCPLTGSMHGLLKGTPLKPVAMFDLGNAYQEVLRAKRMKRIHPLMLEDTCERCDVAALEQYEKTVEELGDSDVLIPAGLGKPTYSLKGSAMYGALGILEARASSYANQGRLLRLVKLMAESPNLQFLSDASYGNTRPVGLLVSARMAESREARKMICIRILEDHGAEWRGAESFDISGIYAHDALAMMFDEDHTPDERIRVLTYLKSSIRTIHTKSVIVLELGRIYKSIGKSSRAIAIYRELAGNEGFKKCVDCYQERGAVKRRLKALGSR